VIRFIYNLLWPIGLLFFLPRYLVKMFRRGGYREKFGQRFGIYDANVRKRLGDDKLTWLHAVSVGEARIALKFAAELRHDQPELRGVLTTTTTTGFAFATRNAPSWIEVMYNPLDFWPIVRRAFRTINPARIVLVEAEIWPNLVAEAHQRGVPIALINARLSSRSEKRFRRFRPLVAPTFRLLELICVQEAADVERWNALGVSRDRIRVTGSIKFDPSDTQADASFAEKILVELKLADRRPVLLGGSTHPGEEQILATVFLELRSDFPGLLLILAPRHVERAREIQRGLEQLGLRAAIRSNVSDASAADCLIIDSTGELQNWYGVADVVFIGKSIAAIGGQNPVEPVAAGKPVIFGPHMENFAVLARDLVEKRGATQIQSTTELKAAVVDLLNHPRLRETLVENARLVIEKHRGATALTAKLVAELKGGHVQE